MAKKQPIKTYKALQHFELKETGHIYRVGDVVEGLSEERLQGLLAKKLIG